MSKGKGTPGASLLRDGMIIILLLAALSSLFVLPSAVARQVWASAGAPRQAITSPPSTQCREDAPQVQLVTSSSQELVLDVRIPPVLEQELRRAGNSYRRLTLPGSGTTTEIGRPELPAFGRFVALPQRAQAQVEVLADQVETRSGYLVYPVQEPVTDQGEEPEFVIDLAAYQRDGYYPSQIVQLEEPAVIRGVQVILLRFHPLQFNAARRELKIHSHFRVRVSFVDGRGLYAEDRLRSPYFEPLLSSVLLNYSQLGPPPAELSAPANDGAKGADFLIITPPDFLAQANLLADWKIRRGIRTEVRTTAETGASAAEIRNYIQNAYETWNPPPSFILFLGDAEFIPPHYETVHPAQPPGDTEIGTDLYYATVDGDDYFPDISTARISVDTWDEAQNLVLKLVDYERNPPWSTGFYSDVSAAAYFEDEDLPYDREDTLWIRTSEEIHTYLDANGYDTQMIYYAEPSVNPLYYSNGDPLPPYLLRDNGFPWNGDTAQIVNAVNTGRLILNHRDHGVRWMWVQPELHSRDVERLTNGDRLPIVFSMNCETGWFDNETDDQGHGTEPNEINFAEAWQRNANGGAAGVIAATRMSYSDYNDHLNKGFYDAIWPDFLPYTPSRGPRPEPQYNMGHVLNYGKFYLATVYGGNITKITFEMFHYFGDPTTEIWTAYPQSLTVSHSPVVLTGVTSFDVNVAQDSALVSLVKNGEILATALSSGGTATVNFPSPLTAGPIHITVTKHDYRPYEGTVVAMDTIYLHYVPLVLAE